MTDDPKFTPWSEQKPSGAQLSYLVDLCDKLDCVYNAPRDKATANRQITNLKKLVAAQPAQEQ